MHTADHGGHAIDYLLRAYKEGSLVHACLMDVEMPEVDGLSESVSFSCECFVLISIFSASRFKTNPGVGGRSKASTIKTTDVRSSCTCLRSKAYHGYSLGVTANARPEQIEQVRGSGFLLDVRY